MDMKKELYEELYEKMKKEYYRVCEECGQMILKADKVKSERDSLILTLREIVAVPVAKSMNNEALILHNIAHKALEEILKL